MRGSRLGASALLLTLALGCTAPAVVLSPTAPTAPAVDSARADGDSCEPGTYSYASEAPPALLALQTDRAWGHATGKGIVVAVVDSGIDSRNVHLYSALVGGINLVGDGENAQGYTDLDGHGTAIAGEIAARPFEGSAVVGVAPDASLLSVRVFRAQDPQTVDAGFGPSAEKISAGIRWAAANGADVISVSLSDYAEGAGLRDAVDFAIANGALVVSSAGNRGTTGYTDDSIRYPAGYDEVLGVAATDLLGVVTDASIHGPQVGVAAPGMNVLTSATGAGDCLYAADAPSTSFATAYASGAAALVAEAHPTESPLQWKYRLEASALRVNPDTRDDRAGWGVIQPYDAITLIPSASTRGPESPFADTASSSITTADAAVTPHSSNSPFGVTRDVLIYVSVAAVSVLGVLALIVALRRYRRDAGGPAA